MTSYLISFGSDDRYATSLASLQKSANRYFDNILLFRDHDIDQDFKNQHARIFEHARGHGYWLWKPYFMTKVMNRMNNGDFLFYTDALNCFVSSPNPLFDICAKNGGVMLFDQLHRNFTYTKRDCFITMGMDSEKYYNASNLTAAMQLYQKNELSQHVISEYLKYCSNYAAVSDAASKLGPELPGFIHHRHDQSILSLIAAHLDIKTYRDPSQWGNISYEICRKETDSPYEQVMLHHRNFGHRI